jgi:LPXTG-site transpeptidase (sortase) family protein
MRIHPRAPLAISLAAFLLVVSLFSHTKPAAADQGPEILSTQPSGALPYDYFVDTYEDDVTLSACTLEPSDCSLRGAVEKANAAQGANSIYLPTGTYVLRGEKSEDKNQTGDLDILQTGGNLAIIGEGSGSTIITNEKISGVDRIFDLPDFASLRTLSIKNLTIQNGNPGISDPGGAIRSYGGLVIENVSFMDNTARQGGAIFFYHPYSAQMLINNATFVNNMALLDGGAIYNWGSAEIKNSLFLGNQANGFDVAGILPKIPSSGPRGQPVETQISEERGGAIFNASQLSISTTTFTQNNALKGGAIANNAFGGARTQINNATFWANTSAIHNLSSTTSGTFESIKFLPVLLSNSILGGSGSGDNCTSNTDGEKFVEDLGNNIDNGNTCSLSKSLVNTDPLLAPIQDNGGPTQTNALKEGSPAIDTGNPATCSFRDQRGLSSIGKCDIGAFEYGAQPNLWGTGGVMGATTLGGALASPLKVYLTNGYGNPLTDWRVEFKVTSGYNVLLNPTLVESDRSGLAVTEAALIDSSSESVVTASVGTKSINFRLSKLGAIPVNHISAIVLPTTGFAPETQTSLPVQPERVRYTKSGELELEIPKLNIRIPILSVPKSEEGWNTTWLSNQAGYLEGTAFPTWAGNSVLAGHVVLATGLPGPFAGLSTLGWGDRIIVHAWGQKYIFEVRSIASVTPDNMSALKHEENSWLTLITCQNFDPVDNQYHNRLVVRSVLLSTE